MIATDFTLIFSAIFMRDNKAFSVSRWAKMDPDAWIKWIQSITENFDWLPSGSAGGHSREVFGFAASSPSQAQTSWGPQPRYEKCLWWSEFTSSLTKSLKWNPRLAVIMPSRQITTLQPVLWPFFTISAASNSRQTEWSNNVSWKWTLYRVILNVLPLALKP